MAKEEVYSWRVSAELKEEMEEAARREGTSLAALLERIATSWLESSTDSESEEEQRRLHEAAARTFGSIEGGDPHRSERARERLRERLGKKRAG